MVNVVNARPMGYSRLFCTFLTVIDHAANSAPPSFFAHNPEMNYPIIPGLEIDTGGER